MKVRDISSLGKALVPIAEELLLLRPGLSHGELLLVQRLGHVGQVHEEEVRVEPDQTAYHMHCWDLQRIHTVTV